VGCLAVSRCNPIREFFRGAPFQLKETMGYFDTDAGVDEYIKLAEGYDGRELIEILRSHVPSGSSVLELGMGPGVDLALLQPHFEATGSDSSAIFVDRYRALEPSADVLVLDAVDLETERRFDAIYSNKVLQHLSKQDAGRSLAAQHRILNPGGTALHALWFGDKLEEHHGLLFQQYTAESFSEFLGEQFEVLEAKLYAEMEPDDSLSVVIRRVD
jgi:SAM-dependent methyltransferase